MIIRKEMDIGDLLDEIYSDTADTFVEMFGDHAEGALESWLDDMEEDECAARVEANKVEILADIVKARGTPLTREEMRKLCEECDITESEIDDADIEHEEPLIDEDGREYVWVEEDPRQMTLWAEDGPPMRVRRYVA